MSNWLGDLVVAIATFHLKPYLTAKTCIFSTIVDRIMADCSRYQNVLLPPLLPPLGEWPRAFFLPLLLGIIFSHGRQVQWHLLLQGCIWLVRSHKLPKICFSWCNKLFEEHKVVLQHHHDPARVPYFLAKEICWCPPLPPPFTLLWPRLPHPPSFLPECLSQRATQRPKI